MCALPIFVIRVMFLLLLLISTFFAFSNVALAQEAPPPSGGGMFDWESGDEDKRKSLESWQQTFSMPSACWGCELFSTMARVTLGFGKIGEDIFPGPDIAPKTAFLGLWVVWKLYLFLSTSHTTRAAPT